MTAPTFNRDEWVLAHSRDAADLRPYTSYGPLYINVRTRHIMRSLYFEDARAREGFIEGGEYGSPPLRDIFIATHLARLLWHADHV